MIPITSIYKKKTKLLNKLLQFLISSSSYFVDCYYLMHLKRQSKRKNVIYSEYEWKMFMLLFNLSFFFSSELVSNSKSVPGGLFPEDVQLLND